MSSIAEAPASIDAGDRVHLIVYAERLGAPVRLLVLPVGD
jgi:hypothetical protein